MTTTVTPTLINEGEKKLVVHLLIESDGASGELTNYSILDPQVDFTPTLDASTQLTLMQAWCDCIWFDVLLRANALNPVTLWAFNRSREGYTDFRYFGGLKDRSTTDHDGKILISTNGLADVSASTGTMVLEFRKN